MTSEWRFLLKRWPAETCDYSCSPASLAQSRNQSACHWVSAPQMGTCVFPVSLVRLTGSSVRFSQELESVSFSFCTSAMWDTAAWLKPTIRIGFIGHVNKMNAGGWPGGPRADPEEPRKSTRNTPVTVSFSRGGNFKPWHHLLFLQPDPSQHLLLPQAASKTPWTTLAWHYCCF